MTTISAHELTRTRLCDERGCGDDADVEVAGEWFCHFHARGRANGTKRRPEVSAKRAAPEPTPASAVTAAEPEPETPKCSKCDEPGVTRYGRAMLCEAHDAERREKTSQSVRKRNEQRRQAARVPIPGGLEEQLSPALRLADETWAAHEEAREALRRAIDEALR